MTAAKPWRAPPFPKCGCCDNRFARSDKRGTARSEAFVRCPLCYAVNHGWGSWSVKNDCNGIFETRETRAEAQALLEVQYGGVGARVVPSMTLEVVDEIAIWRAHDDENQREARERASE